MTSHTSSTIDDQQAQHYIGSLLYDDDPFSPPSSNQFESNSAQQLSSGSVLPSGGGIGPSPNQAFWPEPPPPYSPYSVRPPQWLSISHQPPELFSGQLRSSFGQIPAFYSPPVYNRHREWETIGNGSLDGYPLVGSNIPYASHAALTRSMSGHYVAPDGFQHRGGCYGSPFHSYVSPEPLQMDSPHMTSNDYFRNESVMLNSSNLDLIPSVPPSLIEVGTCLPLAGKSYRDAASEKKRTSSSASAASAFSNLSSPGDFKMTSWGHQDLQPGGSKVSSFGSGGKGVSSEPQKTEGVQGKVLSTSNFKKTKTASARNPHDNEFQKITRKKTKRTKANKGDQVATDEDGLASNQAVDASSRFDVLQSLNSQTNSSSRTPSTVPGVINKSHGSTQLIKAKKVGNESSCKSQVKRQKQAAVENPTLKVCTPVAFTSTVSGLFQRAALRKGVFGFRRDPGESFAHDTPRFASRKQRGGARKRNNQALDYLIRRNLIKVLHTAANERGIYCLRIYGDEAMNRLLRCRGQDAYAVLGLRADCTDEEIKYYYKRQAFLVHPDKNFSDGAAEAFKILSKAFEAVGTSETRATYNLTCLSSPVHKELEELWQRLHDKLEETKNSLPCDCGKRHRRMPVKNASLQQARYCKRCNVRHAAKQNDIWAESTFLGLYWTYFACLDGIIYDISQWANCPKNNLKNLKANAHTIQYCMVSYPYGPLARRDISLKRAKKSTTQHYETEDCDFPSEDYRYGIDDNFSYVASRGFNDLNSAPQLAPCRSFDRRLFNQDRPRRTGRKKRLH